MELALAVVAFLLAMVPAMLFLRNVSAYQPPLLRRGRLPAVSVLIPARNEEKTIGAAVATALNNEGISLEILVLDDGSTDATAIVVDAIASVDPRVRLVRGPPLEPGWCGKQHACAELARQAANPLLCFMDADVRLGHDTLARMAAFLETGGADLASGIPRQETVTFLEKLLIPLIHFVLLAFLPLHRMRRSTHPAYAAGCGQLFIAKASAYREAGGHAAIRASLHDGINLPRAFRRAGFKTDLFDATGIATCRMYRTNAEVWHGLSKNATEGLAAPSRILPVTLILALGQVAPLILVFVSGGFARAFYVAALFFIYLPRLVASRRFQQPVLGAILHPMSILLLLGIQWQAFLRRLFGVNVNWKGRSYHPADLIQPR